MNVVKLTELLEITKFSKSCCYRQIKNGTAPSTIKLGGGVVVWLLDVVNAWLEKIGKQSKQESAEIKRSVSNFPDALTFFNTYSILKRG